MRSTTPANVSADPSGIWIGIARGAQALLDPGHRGVEVRADAVHLVDERDARHVVAVGLVPDGLRLRLDAFDAVEDDDRAVQHAQRALDLGREVDVPRRVDQVDPVVAATRASSPRPRS